MKARKKPGPGRWALPAIAMLAWLLAAQPAAAAKTDLYEHFTACPTGAPEMNDPDSVGAICFSSIAREGLLKVGNFQAPITSPVQIQFAFTSEPKAEPPPEGPVNDLVPVPGSVSLDGAPLVIPNPFATPPPAVQLPAAAAPTAPAKKKKKRKKCKGKRGKHKQGKHQGKKGKGKGKRCKGKAGKGKGKGGGGAVVPAPPATPPPPKFDPFIRGTIEVAGDLLSVNLAAVFGEPEPLFEMPVKLHLEGTGLGPSCYIGSNADPIVLAPVAMGPPSSFQLATDPNGFRVDYIGLGGAASEDDAFAVPAARGCGQVDPGSGQGSLDATINALIGLPAISGGSKAVFQNVLIEMAGAENNGEPPESGAELQAAFDAAR